MIVKILSEIVMVIYNYIYSYYNNIEIIFLLCVLYNLFFFKLSSVFKIKVCTQGVFFFLFHYINQIKILSFSH